MEWTAIARTLNNLYRAYNRPEYVHPDPLELVCACADPRDREVVALVAGTLAYGRVKQVLASARRVLDRMTPSPRRFLERTPPAGLRETFAGFRHRFSDGEQLASLLAAAGRLIRRYGSLRACFLAGLKREDRTVVAALSRFVGRLRAAAPADCGHLLPDPAKGSACKRLNLLLRWLVRRDDVDPGGWEAVGAARLVVPLDTHMHRLAAALGLTRRRQADLRTALEITAAFRNVAPEDPVRYDFALTRLGIHPQVAAGATAALRGAAEAGRA